MNVLFIANLDVYQELPKKDRTIVKEFIRTQSRRGLKSIRLDNEIAMLGLMKRGVKMIRVPPEEIEQ